MRGQLARHSTAVGAVRKETLKMKSLIAACSGLSIVVLAAGLLTTAVVAQEGGNQSGAAQNASAQGAKKNKQDRWEGFVTRSDMERRCSLSAK